MSRAPGLKVAGLVVCLAALPPHVLAAEGKPDMPSNRDTVALTVEGITPHTGDDDPGVLYILPWQPPTLPRRSRAELEAGSEELLEPQDPLTLERHRKFRETLNPSLDSTLSLQ